MAVDRDTVEQQLESLGDFFQFFTSKELRFLPQILSDGETIHGVTSGLYEGKTWVIVITDARIIFLDKGMFYGLRQIDMPLAQISSVSNKTGFFFGEIQVATSSGSKTIANIARKDVIKICSIVSGLLNGTRRKPEAPKALSNDLTTQLEKLFTLKEKGALTDAEYATTKAKILNSDLF